MAQTRLVYLKNKSHMIRKAESSKILQMCPKQDFVYTFGFFCF